jgi:hypothetical protein
MTDEELWEAVVEPAELVGVSLERSLAETLVAVAPEAGLAALSLTMSRLWHTRDSDLLTLAAYHSGPSMPSIIAATGEAVIASLNSDAARVAAGRILASFAARTTEEVLVARAVPTAQLLAAAGPAGPQALAALREHNLVTISGDMAEVVHEELLVGWPRLRGWLDEESAQRGLRAHLARAASAWSGSGSRPEDLYRGARLAAALEYAAAHSGELSAVERDFLAASHRVVQVAETRQRRKITKLWRWLIAMTLVLAATHRGRRPGLHRLAGRDLSARRPSRLVGASGCRRAGSPPGATPLGRRVPSRRRRYRRAAGPLARTRTCWHGPGRDHGRGGEARTATPSRPAPPTGQCGCCARTHSTPRCGSPTPTTHPSTDWPSRRTGGAS